MQRQRGELVPIGAVISGLDDELVPASIPAASPAVQPAPHQPRQPDSVHPSERPVHALHDGGRR